MAALTLDGGVWVSGSCPNNRARDIAVRWPYEYRVEKYFPPYLLTSFPRPVIQTIIPSTIGYGKKITFRATVASGMKPRVVIINGGFKTHGNSMGQRLVVLVVESFLLVDGAFEIVVSSPPRAEIAPPGYYFFFVVDGGVPGVGRGVQVGGDPARIRNWAVNMAPKIV